MADVYLVGGAVRDELLGLAIHEQDWVVVGSTPEAMIEQGYQQVGKDFPVFLHPQSKEEYALARTERKSGSGYTGFVCDFAESVTLEDDLMRRDLTINAIAKSKDGEYVDPYHGLQDIKARKLRHVSEAFREDPLRVLRVARFAARFHQLGFTIAEGTAALMQAMSASGELEALVAERIWKETEKALLTSSPHIYFQVLHDCGALAVLFPEIEALFGVPQTEKHHPEIDSGIHTLMVLEQAALLSDTVDVRLAALLHDLGKGLTPQEEWPRHIGHEHKGIKAVKALCKRTRIPNDLTQLSVLASQFHLHSHRAFELRPETVAKMFKQLDAYRKPERFHHFILACEADARGRKGFEQRPYPQADYLRSCFEAARKISKQHVNETLSGPAIGEAIEKVRVSVIKQVKANFQETNHD